MSITIKSTRKNLEKYASEVLANCIRKLLKKQQRVVFAIPGGRSVSALFRMLQKMPVPWDRIHLFMADERIVPPGDPDSNFREAKEGFIDQLINENILQKDNIHPFIINTREADRGLSRYEQEFQHYGGRADIVLLSAGEDGHVASLFPNHPSIQNESERYITISDSPKEPKQRITMSRKLIQRAHYVLLLFFGEEKGNAYRLFVSDDADIISCPAKLVLSVKDSYIFTDIEE